MAVLAHLGMFRADCGDPLIGAVDLRPYEFLDRRRGVPDALAAAGLLAEILEVLAFCRRVRPTCTLHLHLCSGALPVRRVTHRGYVFEQALGRVPAGRALFGERRLVEQIRQTRLDTSQRLSFGSRALLFRRPSGQHAGESQDSCWRRGAMTTRGMLYGGLTTPSRRT